MKVPFVDLGTQHAPLRAEILKVWEDVLDETRFVGGRAVAAFEADFAALHDVEHGVAVSSGTDALFIAMRALGVGPGDRVVVPANTFIATAEAISLAGASPYIVDCDPQTKNISIPAAIAALNEPDVRGVIAVHLYGQPADVDPLVDHAARHDQWVLEDAAQAHMARYKGRSIGGLGTAAGFSFYPSKNLGAPGEGGAVLTDNSELAATMRALRDHGQTTKYQSTIVGLNGRMHELVAATLNVKLPHLKAWTAGRRRVAAKYHELLATIPSIELPFDPDWTEPVHHLFVVHVPHRDRVSDLMEAAGIGVGRHYPVPIHLQEAYRDLGHSTGDFPVAETSARSLLSLPMFPELANEAIEFVASSLVSSVERAAAEAA